MEEKTMDQARVGNLLKGLFWLNAAALAMSWVSLIPAVTKIMGWIALIVPLANAIVLFSLAQVGKRYRLAGILYGIAAAGNLLLALVGLTNNVLATALNICSLVGLFNEYKGHAELIEKKDAKLASRWSTLFVLTIVMSFVSAMLTVATVMIGFNALMIPQRVAVLSIVLGLIPTLVVQVLYLVYLNRTRQLVEEGL